MGIASICQIDPPAPLFKNDRPPTVVQRIETSAPAVRSDAETERSSPATAANQPNKSPIRRPTPPTELESTFRHSFWAARRARVLQAIKSAGEPERRVDAFAACGSGALVLLDEETGHTRLAAHHCHDRFCEACQMARRHTIQRNLIPLVEEGRTLHIVLTQKSSDRDLAKSIKKLYADAAKLRRRPFWQNRVAGGSQTLEVTFNTDTREWHPHLHLLVRAEWLQLQDLSQEWLTVTGDSHRVHVSLVRSNASAVREVTKYLGKITHRSYEQDTDAMIEAVIALKGTRLITTFGIWRGKKLTHIDKPPTPVIWKIWGTLEQLIALAQTGNTWARETLHRCSIHHTHPTADRGSAHDAAP